MTADDTATRLRLFATCWLIVTLHFATNIAREHYPALALAEHGTLAVDEYVGLHPDIFIAPNGHAYINNNPGVSMLAAVPLVLSRPLLRFAENAGRARVARGGTGAVYDDPHPNRVNFYKAVHARGLDLKFGVVSIVTVALCMAPLVAAAAVTMFGAAVRRGMVPRDALWAALLLALGTPILFRAAYLNHNLALALAAFGAFVLLWDPEAGRGTASRYALAGLLAGATPLFDYSGAVSCAFLTAYALLRRPAVSRLAAFTAGAAVPILVLFAYQWSAFGHPLRVPQMLMPPTVYSVAGHNGLTWPQADLLWANLVDPRFGLLAFCPLLALAIPGFWVTPESWLTRSERRLIALYTIGFLLFCSANQFARLQWNTGVRYLLPLVPFLFLLVVPVLQRLPRRVAVAIAGAAFVQSWAIAMIRDDAFVSIKTVLAGHIALPWLTVFSRTHPAVSSRDVLWLTIALLTAAACGLALVWGSRLDVDRAAGAVQADSVHHDAG